MKYKITHKQTKTLPDTLRYNDWIFGIFLDVPLYFTVFDRDDMWHRSQGECWCSPRFGFSSPVLRSYYTLEGGSKVLKHNIHCLFDLEWSKTNSPQLQSIALLTVWSISAIGSHIQAPTVHWIQRSASQQTRHLLLVQLQ